MASHSVSVSIDYRFCVLAAGYPENEPACVDVLTEPGAFELWAQLEQAEATKCLDVFLTEPDAWLLRYGDNTNSAGDLAHMDSHKVSITSPLFC